MFKRTLKSFFTTIYKLNMFLKGYGTVVEVFKHNRNIGSLKTEFVNGHTLEIFCRKREYIRSYEHDWLNGKIYTVYDVYSVAGPDAPLNIQKVSEITITFPPLVPTYLSDSYHCKVLINAYLDMIHVKLNEITYH